MLHQEATLFVSIDHVKDFAVFLLASGAQCASNSNGKETRAGPGRLQIS